MRLLLPEISGVELLELSVDIKVPLTHQYYYYKQTQAINNFHLIIGV